MNQYARNCPSTVIPGLRYRNAKAMIDWLCNAFGFERRAVYSGPGDIVQHSELTFGNGMIMIGSVENESASSSLMKQPDEIGGAETQSVSLLVADCDAIYSSAMAAGAVIVFELREMEYGGSSFTCRDPEGHIWHFGTYDPWTADHSGADPL